MEKQQTFNEKTWARESTLAQLVLGCGFTSAQTFGFASAGGSYLYCNYEILAQVTSDLWEGADILNLCGGKPSGNIAGTKAGITASGNPFGFSVQGVAYADDIYDAFSGTWTDAWRLRTTVQNVRSVSGSCMRRIKQMPTTHT